DIIQKEDVLILSFDDGYGFYHNRRCRMMCKDDLVFLSEKIKECIDKIDSEKISNEDVEEWNEWNRKKNLDDIKNQTSYSKNEKKSVFLYLIQNSVTNNFKIGVSKNPKKRLNQLNIASDNKLTLLYSIENKSHLENETHSIFSHLKINNEWFKYDYSIIEYFQKLNN